MKGPIFVTLVHESESTEYGFDVPTAEAMIADMKRQVARAKRIMGTRKAPKAKKTGGAT